MIDSRKNIRNFVSGLIFILVVIFIGFLFNNNSSGLKQKFTDRQGTEITSGNINSVVSSGIDLCTFQRIMNFQRECFSKIYLMKNQVLENRTTTQKISLFRIGAADTQKFSFLFHHYHLFISDNDDLPPLY
jgi:hypothetical protein